MKKPDIKDMAGVRMLTDEEIASTMGGGIIDYLMKFASWGASYFFHMGVTEGRRMRALL